MTLIHRVDIAYSFVNASGSILYYFIDAEKFITIFCFHKSNSVCVDIVVQDGETLIPIELKYKTKGFSGKFGDVDIVLKNHGAQDQGRYDFLKDIERLEGFCGCKKYTVGTGYAIFLTNDSMYWEPSKRDCVDQLFRIHKGREITGDIHWVGETKPGTTKGRDKPLHLEGQYQITWNPYELAKNKKLQFQYTIIKINKINKKQ